MCLSKEAVTKVLLSGDQDKEEKDLFPAISDFRPPISASHNFIVWSMEALKISLLSLYTASEMASLCPGSVINGVFKINVQIKNWQLSS